MDILRDSIVGNVLCVKLPIILSNENKVNNQTKIYYYSPARLEYLDVK